MATQGITVEVKGLGVLRQQITSLNEAEMGRILKAAINKGVKASRTEASDHITTSFTVKKSTLFSGVESGKKSDKLRIYLATDAVKPSGSLYAVGGPGQGLRLVEFKYSVVRTGVNVWQYRGVKSGYKHAWVMKFPNGPEEGVFWREKAGQFEGSTRKFTPQQFRAMPEKYRRPVVHLRGFSAAQMLDEGDGVEKARKRGEEVYLEEADRLIELKLNGGNF